MSHKEHHYGVARLVTFWKDPLVCTPKQLLVCVSSSPVSAPRFPCSSRNCFKSAGMKAGRVLKKTTSSLITTRWTGDRATTPALSPSAAPLSVQQGQHCLLEADSVLAREVSNLRTAAALEQIDASASEAALPAEVNFSSVRASAHDESAAALHFTPTQPAPAQPAPTQPAPTQPDPTQPDPAQPAPTLLAPQPPAAVEHAPAVDSLESSSAIPRHAQPAPTDPPAHAQPAAAVEPAPDAVVGPAQLVSPAPPQAAVPAKPEFVFQPTRVLFRPSLAPKAALPVVLSQPALPQATPAPQATMHSHDPLAEEGCVGVKNEDKVVSSGCWGTFCCFNAGRREKHGIFGRRKQ